ncbi:MAG: hypothetical protein ACFFDH_18385 [Promethearchaeota archaeon]
MSYSDAGYVNLHRDNERVASIIRGATQSALKDFKKKVIDETFRKKIVNKVNIGEICSMLTIKIIGSFKELELESNFIENKKVISHLLMILLIDYELGINPFDDIVWRKELIEKGFPLLGEKINTLPGTGKVASMDKLESPKIEKDEKEFSNFNW